MEHGLDNHKKLGTILQILFQTFMDKPAGTK